MLRSLRIGRRRSGFVLIWVAAGMFFIVPMVGLAIDVGVLYVIKSRLTGAVDAAVLAGAQSFSAAIGFANQQRNATDIATAYFNANFPPGAMGTSNATFVPAASVAGALISVTMNGTMDAPLFFLRALPGSPASLRIGASGTAQRQLTNIILVLDRSSSMSGATCQAMVSSAQTFVNQFADGQDRLGLVVFGGSYEVSFPPSLSFKSASPSLNDKLVALGVATCNGNTGTAQALWVAYEQLLSLRQPGALNAIVLFTDGEPNGLTADWPMKNIPTPGRLDASGGAAPAAKSTCTDMGTKRGFMARWGFCPQCENGIFGWQASSIGNDPGMILPNSSSTENMASPGFHTTHNNVITSCSFVANGSGAVNKDVAYIPATDIYGNDTTGSSAAQTGFQTSYKYPGGDAFPNTVRVDWYNSVLDNSMDTASANAALSAAFRIRANTPSNVDGYSGIDPVIYAIGLGGASDAAPDQFLKEIANDLTSDRHQANQQTGLYVFAPDAAALQKSFAQIAGVLLRISH